MNGINHSTVRKVSKKENKIICKLRLVMMKAKMIWVLADSKYARSVVPPSQIHLKYCWTVDQPSAYLRIVNL